MDFKHWPTWLWANWELVALIEWLRNYNDGRPDKVGFYGLDVYSLWKSTASIIAYLEKADPAAAKTAKKAYSCFEPYGRSAEQYAWNVAMVSESYEPEVVDLLVEMRRNPRRYNGNDEDAFSAEQIALVMVDAKRYYRSMVRGEAASWNIRDKHMFDTLVRLMEFHGPDSKAVVWAHYTHVGGVVYDPAFEQLLAHSLPRRCDALLSIDKNLSLHQLHVVPESNVPPELYPWGI